MSPAGCKKRVKLLLPCCQYGNPLGSPSQLLHAAATQESAVLSGIYTHASLQVTGYTSKVIMPRWHALNADVLIFLVLSSTVRCC